jgi:hypothetical protein
VIFLSTLSCAPKDYAVTGGELLSLCRSLAGDQIAYSTPTFGVVNYVSEPGPVAGQCVVQLAKQVQPIRTEQIEHSDKAPIGKRIA